MTTQLSDRRFASLLRQIEDWHVDGVRAMNYDASPGRSSRGSRILHAGKYHGPDYRQQWETANDAHARRAILTKMADEVYGFSHAPSEAASAVSDLYVGTREWKLKVAMAPGTLRAVARRFNTNHERVRRLRIEFAEDRDRLAA